MSELYIGLMSGTSADGIDAALVDFSGDQPKLLHGYYKPFSHDLRQCILELYQPGIDEIKRMGNLDIALGHAFAGAANQLLQESQISSKNIRAIGCHGQTLRHDPACRYTLQVGDPNIIAAKTGITTIADFRRRDMAYGGQGAPLVPAFHQTMFAQLGQHRAIVNIGGIANVTLLLGDQKTILGFDTGPGNALMDAWIERHLQQPYDKQGAWASQGNINHELLNTLLADPFFHLAPPKSTGRDYFNLQWLERYLTPAFSAVDVQATLAALTAQSIIAAIKPYFLQGEIIVCGGGAHNNILINQIKEHAAPLAVSTTREKGIDPHWIEAMAFAWLAKQTLTKQTGNMTAVTGASQAAILGGVYQV